MRTAWLLLVITFGVLRCGSSIGGQLHAQAFGEPMFSGTTIYFENDLLSKYASGVGTDRNYTMTFTASVSGAGWARTLGFPRDLIDRLTKVDRIFQSTEIGGSSLPSTQGDYRWTDRITVHDVLLGGSAFTPRDISNPDPIPGDRPYSFILFLSSAEKRLNLNVTTAVSSELSLGIAGTRVGEHVQTWIHENISGSPIPNGWNNQICDGGCPIVRYTLSIQRLIADGDYTDFQVVGNGSVGAQTNLAVGGGLRLGIIDSPWYTLSGDLQTTLNSHIPPLQPAFSSYSPAAETVAPNWVPAAPRSEQSSEIYGFVNGRTRLVGYNMLLQGYPWGNDPVTFKSSDIERLVLEFQAGISGGVGPFRGTLSFNGRTPEFEGPYARAHYWGGIYISYFRPILAT